MNYPTTSDLRLSGRAGQQRATSRKLNLKVANRLGRKMSKSNLWMKACGVFLLWAATAVVLSAQTFTVLLSFDGTNNSQPDAGLVQAPDGNFYGTAVFGGPTNNGTVFKVTSSGTLTTVHTFDGTDGSEPFSTPVLSTDGNLYGTTSYGGANGQGTVFKVTPGGTLTTLHSFDGPDGTTPQAGLARGADGNLYGAALYTDCNEGSFFKVTSSGAFTALHVFSGRGDGGFPYGAPIQASDGNFFGTTFSGGCADEGTVYKITPGGTLNTIHSFCLGGIPCPDGGNTVAGLVQGSDGNLYGATARGGDGTCIFNGFEGCGTVFKIGASSGFTTLHLLESTDGASPFASLVQGTDGNFYGTANGLGANGDGTIFQVTSSGTFTVLHNFDGTDGIGPVGPLMQGTDGAFYGTTSSGGANGVGTIFRLSMGLGPFVKTLPAFGTVGATIGILGTNLTGTTGVSFNGTPATFTVVSTSFIRTSVPAGATTGSVEVATPRGTLTSNVVFRVKL